MKEHFIMSEGDANAEVYFGEDAAHGPYCSYTFPCGNIIFIYNNKPSLVTFYTETEKENDDDDWFTSGEISWEEYWNDGN